MAEEDPQIAMTPVRRPHPGNCICAECESLREDAAKWRALRNCARITALGSAGLTMPRTDGYAHVTLNFWTHGERESNSIAREWLDKFVAAARSTDREGADRG